jgi:leader peptidase (prepilin peptidase)/N-methyltransferase
MAVEPSFILLGLVIVSPFIGSFLGVVISRSGVEPVLGRSRCESCGHQLGGRDLIPLVSWTVLKGHCRYCGAKLGWFYPVVELIALVPVLWAATLQDGWLLAASAVFAWLLLALAWTDVRTQRLPNALTISLIVAGLAACAIYDRDAILDHIIGAIAGFAAFWLVGLVYRRLRGKDGLGLGDAKLVAGLGALIAWEGLASVIFLGAMIGIALVLVRAFVFGKASLRERLPFGPALALAGWIVWLYGPLIPA